MVFYTVDVKLVSLILLLVFCDVLILSFLVYLKGSQEIFPIVCVIPLVVSYLIGFPSLTCLIGRSYWLLPSFLILGPILEALLSSFPDSGSFVIYPDVSSEP